MKAIRAHRFGGPEVLALEDVPAPRPAEGEVLVRVVATSVNPIDWKYREGYFEELSLPFIPGGDFSGTIDELGAKATGFAIGDAVYGCAKESLGAEAELLVVPAATIAKKPRTIDHIRAAAVPLASMTAWQALFEHGRLDGAKRILILGASGGVGGFAVQFAKERQAFVYGTASTENVSMVRDLGCDQVIDYKKERIEDVAKDVDLCIDLVGGDFQKRAFTCVKKGGRLVSTVQPPDEGLAKARGVAAMVFRMKPSGDQLREIAKRIDDGRVKIAVAKVMPLEKASEAEELNRQSRVNGKIVLEVGR